MGRTETRDKKLEDLISLLQKNSFTRNPTRIKGRIVSFLKKVERFDPLGINSNSFNANAFSLQGNAIIKAEIHIELENNIGMAEIEIENFKDDIFNGENIVAYVIPTSFNIGYPDKSISIVGFCKEYHMRKPLDVLADRINDEER